MVVGIRGGECWAEGVGAGAVLVAAGSEAMSKRKPDIVVAGLGIA